MLGALLEAALWVAGYVAACVAVVLAAGQVHDRFRERVCPFCDNFLTNPELGCDWCARHGSTSPSQEEGQQPCP